jgi:hypothetical protein
MLELALNKIDIKSEATGALRDRVLDCRNNPDTANALLIEITQEKEVRDCSMCENRHFCSLFLACLYYELCDIKKTHFHIKATVKDFNRLGSNWNELFARWINGIIYLRLGDAIPAQSELNHAKEMLEKIALRFRKEDNYEKRDECYIYTENIQETLKTHSLEKTLVKIMFNNNNEDFETHIQYKLLKNIAENLGIHHCDLEMESKRAKKLEQLLVEYTPTFVAGWSIKNYKKQPVKEEFFRDFSQEDLTSTIESGIDSIWDKIIEHPLLGAKALDNFVDNKANLRQYQDLIDLHQTKLLNIYKDGNSFEWTSKHKKEEKRLIKNLLSVCSEIKKRLSHTVTTQSTNGSIIPEIERTAPPLTTPPKPSNGSTDGDDGSTEQGEGNGEGNSGGGGDVNSNNEISKESLPHMNVNIYQDVWQSMALLTPEHPSSLNELRFYQNDSTFSSSALPNDGYLSTASFPIYGKVKAGENGVAPMLDEPDFGSAKHETNIVRLNGEEYQIYTLDKNRIKIVHDNFLYSLLGMTVSEKIAVKGEQIGWLKVEGNSMNKSHPIAIEEDDYILIKENHNLDTCKNKIVVITHPTHGTENIHPMVKRLIIQGSDNKNQNKRYLLRSESTENSYKNISINDGYQLVGEVIAAAKPKGKI